MKIHSMTATFGKLDHETLTLKPGLNILEAPNEWGKSTWCAFLTAMLYGLDTRAKSTKTALADKEHFAPWSGKPMSGRMDLNWNGRDITIERTTRGRVPMGEFRAYETATGLAVPELNGANCGQILLGIERSVFLRSGFIRISFLNATVDVQLRRRLNALVTTGDDSGRAEDLASGLKELKNRIRYNRSGLLPQAEGERERLENTLRELQLLTAQRADAQVRMDQVKDWQLLLENHRQALEFAAAQEQEAFVCQAEQAVEAARQSLETLDVQCTLYPDRGTAAEVLEEIERLRQEQQNLETALAELAEPEAPVGLPEIFAGMEPEEAIVSATWDRNRHWYLSDRRYYLLVLGALVTVLGFAAVYWSQVPGLICGGIGLLLLLVDGILQIRRRREKRKLEEYYGGQIADRWIRSAEAYASTVYGYRQAKRDAEHQRQELGQLLESLRANVAEATEGRGLEACREEWLEVLSAWDQREIARAAYAQAEDHCRRISAMAKPSAAPEFPDRMDYSREETDKLLAQCAGELQHLENRLGMLQGRMDALGDPEELKNKLEAANGRISQLEKTYEALLLAQETLGEAAAQLQRRFAPRIASRAQELMGKLTDGRYDRVNLREDLSLLAGADREDILREVHWRSDGTVDQLYLALRLAVAEELAPQAPLILDDALVRFDDVRLKAALGILRREAEEKQVLLFTCHSREKQLISSGF